MSPLHRLLLQAYALAVTVAAIALDNDWRVLLGGAVGLPLVSELPRGRAVGVARPAEWTQADEVLLRAREAWAGLLRRAFWVAWVIGWIAADRISAVGDPDDAVLLRSLTITAAMILLVAGAFLTRRQVSAAMVRRAEAAVRAEGKYVGEE